MGATSDKVQGQAKQVAGIVTGDRDLEAQGKAERQTGEAEEKLDEARERVAGYVDEVRDKAEAGVDKATEMLPGK